MTGSSFLADLLETVNDRGRALLRRSDPNGPSGPGGPDALIDLCEALLSGRGEATGLAIAARQTRSTSGSTPMRAMSGT